MTLEDQWRNKWVVVGGGSRGLGLAISLQLAKAGAKLAIIGREPEALNHALDELKRVGAPEVQLFAVDLARVPNTDDHEATRLQEFCRDQPIALSIAAVGKSDRGFLATLQATDIQHAIAINVVSSLQLAQWCMEGLRRGTGKLVFIASIAGLANAAGLGAYSLSKAAQIAMVRQLRKEHPDVPMTLVCTGPIQREDSGNRYEQIASERGLPEHLNAPGGGVKIKALDPNELADRILRCVVVGKKELIIPWKVKLLLAISSFFPNIADRLIQKSFRKQ